MAETAETNVSDETRLSESADEPLRIALTNQKGGVGKSTTAINVSGALSQRGANVLLVDCDPQGMSSDVLGYENYYFGDRIDDEDSDAHGVEVSMYDLLCNDDGNVELTDLIFQDHPEIDVLPAHIDMFLLDRELPGTKGAEQRMLSAFDTADLSHYDFIIYDSPPYLGVLNDMVLLASDEVLIPAQSRTSSIRALRILLNQIETVEETFDTDIEIVGLVANESRQDNESGEMIEWFDDVLEGLPVWDVPLRVAIQRSQNEGVTVFEYSESVPDAEQSYLEIADTLIEEVFQPNAN